MRNEFFALVLAATLASIGGAPTSPAHARVASKTVQSPNNFYIPICPYWLCGPPPPHCGGPNNPCPK